MALVESIEKVADVEDLLDLCVAHDALASRLVVDPLSNIYLPIRFHKSTDAMTLAHPKLAVVRLRHVGSCLTASIALLLFLLTLPFQLDKLTRSFFMRSVRV